MNIRSFKDSISVEETIDCKTIILSIIDNYTGVVFKNDIHQRTLVQDWWLFICNNFDMLSMDEVRTAFDMAASGKLSVKLETYYGKFTVVILGKLLNSYLQYRKAVLGDYHTQVDLLESRKPDELKAEKIEKSHSKVMQEYQDLLQIFNATGELDDSKILAYWAEILTKKKAIHFIDDPKIKAEIWEEAKTLAQARMSNSISSDRYSDAQKVNFKKSMQRLREGKSDESHILAATRIYKELLIKKSILNQ